MMMIISSNKSYISLFLIFLSFSLKADISADQMLMIEQLPPDQRENIMEKMESADSLQEEIKEKFEANSSLTIKPEL